MRFHKPLFLLFSILVQSPLLVFSANPPFACDPSDPSSQKYAFCKLTLPIKQRVQDLVSRLTLEEKIAQLGDVSPPIERLGVPAYKWWSESLHGVSSGGRGIHFDGPIKTSTIFPQVILIAAAFNPLLTSKYAASYVRGLQGDPYQDGHSAQVLQASACCKHFTAYDLENWEGIVRDSFNAEVSAQDLEDTFQPPFRSCIEEGHASGIMCAYNQVNGVPNCANYKLLTQTARQKWRFNGYITSDCDAVADIYEAQNYTKTPEDAVAYALKDCLAGMDVNCGNYVQKYAHTAVQQGKLTEVDINRALQNLLSVRMRLGLFNGNPTRYPLYGSIQVDQVCSQNHQNLALKAALDGIVLLKNTGSLLPLSKSQVASLAVIGPNAHNFAVVLGDYAGPPCKIVTPLMGLQSYVGDTRYLAGCEDVACNSSSIDQAVQLASLVDYVVLIMGLDQNQETEAHDRTDLVLPGLQFDLIASVAKAAKKPVILVLLCGGPVDVEFVKSDPKIGAVLWAGYPGQAGGTAIAKILFGEHNPGGKLPVTWYPQDFTRVPMNIMRMRADQTNCTYAKDRCYPGRTYRFYKGYTVFHFGYGLSYSNYSHDISTNSDNQFLTKNTISLHATNIDKNHKQYHIEEIGLEACKNATFPVVVRVKNHGPMDGGHSVLMFMRWPAESNGRPIKQLIGMDNVYLTAGEVVHVTFAVSPCKHLSRATEDGKWVIEEGSHFLMVEEDELEISISA